MRRRMLVPAAVLAACVSGLLPAASARADSTATLPITSFYQIVADTAHGHLFISQGSNSSDDILVTDLAGNEAATISGQDGVKGLALSPDGSTLWRIQSVEATPDCGDCSRVLSASAGVFQPSVLRGRLFSVAATASISSALHLERSVPLGKYCLPRHGDNSNASNYSGWRYLIIYS